MNIEAPAVGAEARTVAVVGNPNCGKTSLFNRLCRTRAKTANFPGTTVDVRLGSMRVGPRRYELVDLPGHYGLNLDRPESRLCREYLAGRVRSAPRPDAVVIVADATNLPRNLVFVSQALQQDLPAVVALNKIDLARRGRPRVDVARLADHLGCTVIPVSARTGEGVDALIEALAAARPAAATLPDPTIAQEASEWAHRVHEDVTERARPATDQEHHHGPGDRLDAVLTHPVGGTVVFAAVMAGLFYTIFALAALPMDLIDLLFARLGSAIGAVLPAGPLRDLVVDGVIAGVAGAVVFLPQICLLFFLISLLEDSGYLARAVFVVDRLLRRFGLPGQSFVPLLSAHACAIPAIMSARLIPDRRDRLATILVAPFMSCSARLPVYVLLIGVLFADRPMVAGAAFTGCYALGAVAALGSAMIARRTILPGPARTMIIELPPYKLPDLRGALLTTLDRARVFLRKAGTLIVAICVVLWWLGEYPRVQPPAAAVELRAEAAADPARADVLAAEADAVEIRHAKAHSFMGSMGRGIQPVFEPLGFDWQVTIGVLSSFLAREVFVSTMAVVVAGSEEEPDETLRQRIASARRTDGRPVFSPAAAASLLVFYVLAMQCLPTLAVTLRETGSWKWPLLQLGWMSGLAYLAAFITYRVMGGA